MAPTYGITPMTWYDTKAKCAALDLAMCEQSCKGLGCFYDFHPVWTGLPCNL